MTTPEAQVEQTKRAQKAIVLAAVDMSTTASSVVAQAAQAAASMGAALHVVQVIEVTPTIALGSSPVLVPSSARLIQQSWQELERLLAAVPASVTEVRGHVTMGSPSGRVLQLATDLEADLLVVGTRDPGKLEAMLFGSTATELVRKAPCPVLVVRPKRHHEPTVPEILPPCPECLEARAASGGKQMWCERHSAHHPSMHTYHEASDAFAVGALTFRDL